MINKKTLRVLILICSSCFISSGYTHAESPDDKCKAVDKINSEVMSSKNYNTKSVEKVFDQSKNSPGCDDGYYAEGFDEIVVKTFAGDFQNLVTAIHKNKPLAEFALKHISSTSDPSDLKVVVKNSQKQCPPNRKSLCKTIKANAEKALAEINSISK